MIHIRGERFCGDAGSNDIFAGVNVIADRVTWM